MKINGERLDFKSGRKNVSLSRPESRKSMLSFYTPKPDPEKQLLVQRIEELQTQLTLQQELCEDLKVSVKLN